MVVRSYNGAARTACDAYTALANGGQVRIYSGTQPAVNGAVPAASQTVLATFSLADTAFNASTASGAGAIATAAGTPITQPQANASGTAGYASLHQSNGTVIHTGSVTVTGGGGDYEIQSLSITQGQQVRLTGMTITLPQVSS